MVVPPFSTPSDVVSEAGPVASGGGEDIIVDVQEPPPPPKKSWKERMLERIQDKAEIAKLPQKSHKKQKENMLTTVLPTVTCSFAAVYSRNLFHNPYKPCAPSQDEVSGILGPLFEILGRRIEIYGKVSQDVLDVTNSIVCGFVYGIRAATTAMQIKDLINDEVELSSRRKQSAESQQGSYQDTPVRAIGDNHSYAQQPAYETTTTGNDSGEFDDDNAGSEEGREYEARQVAQMFKRDRTGREGLGLLPRRVRDENGIARE